MKIDFVRIIAITRKELIQIWRDPRTLVLAIAMPIFLLLLFGYGISFDIKNVPVGVYDQDNSVHSREIIGKIMNCGYFRYAAKVVSPNEVNNLLDRGKCKIIIAFPPGFGKNVVKGTAQAVQLLVDGSESNSATIIVGYIAGILQAYNIELTVRVLNKYGIPFSNDRFPPVKVQPRVWYNPEMRSSNYIVPGVIVTVMTIITIILTSFTIARERERGTLEQLIVTPVKAYEIMIGKLLPYLVIGMVDMIIIFFMGTLVFHVSFRGNFVVLFFTALIFGASGLGFGLLISTLAKTQQVAMMIAWLTSMLPAVLLSGFVFPINSMPGIIQVVTYIIPARYFLVIVRNIFLKGNGLEVFWGETLVLALLAVLTLTICSVRFKKRLD
ncbi:MAG: ABC transporter permease [Elusimicrobiota bacterium]